LPNKQSGDVSHMVTEKEETTKKHLQIRYLAKMWTAGYKYSGSKMEVATQNRTGRRRVVCGLRSTKSNKAVKSRKS